MAVFDVQQYISFVAFKNQIQFALITENMAQNSSTEIDLGHLVNYPLV